MHTALIYMAIAMGQTPEYQPDKTIQTCSGFLTAQEEVYREMERLQKMMINNTPQPGTVSKDAYERSVGLRERAAVLNKTKKLLREKGIIDLECENKISEQEWMWRGKMAENGGEKIDPAQVEQGKASSVLMNEMTSCLKTCQEEHATNQDALMDCISDCNEQVQKKLKQ